MTLVIPPGFGQLAYRFSLTGDPETMIVTCGVEVLFGAADPQAKAEAKADAFAGAFPSAGMVAGWTFLGCVLRTDNSSGSSAIFEAPRNIIGSAPGGTPPQNVAILIRKTTATAGRAHRGRMYLPPICLNETDVGANGMLNPARLTQLQGSMVNAFPGDDMVILHDSLTPGAPPPTPITGFVVDPLVATQRRRLR